MIGADSSILLSLYNLTGKFFVVDAIVVFFSEYVIYILVGIFFFLVFKISSWKERITTFFLGLLSVIISRGILTPLIRFLYERERPFIALDLEPLTSHAASGSFPSGHMTFIIPLVFVIWGMNKKAGLYSFVAAILMGVARVASGLHWITDIAGGLVVGVFAFFISTRVLKFKQTKHATTAPKEKPKVNPIEI